MAKTKEELNQIKNEYESLTAKLQELTEDEIKKVIGGNKLFDISFPCTIHHNDFFIDYTGLSIIVYDGLDKEVQDRLQTLPIRVYDKENPSSSELKFVYVKNARAIADTLYFKYSFVGNVADGKYIFVDK